MDRETNIVVQCARTFLNPAAVVSLETALAGQLNWNEVERNAEKHCIAPIVAYLFSHRVGELIPQDRLKRLRDRLLRAARNNLAWVQEWLQLLKALREAGIPVISFKGPTLGLMAYRNLALREFSDLDLLVQPHDVCRTRDVLVRNGYVLSSVVLDDTDAALTLSSSREISFIQEERGTMVDLHWGVLDEKYSFQLEVGHLFEAAHVECHERISFLSLSPEHLLLYLCAHGTKHCWRNLRWLCDVAYHIQANHTLNWDLCIRLAEPAGCKLILKHSLLLTGCVLGLRLPEPISQYANQDTKAHMLAKTARIFLFRKGDDRPRYLDVLRYHQAFAKGWRNAASLVVMPLFVPAVQDWHYVRLPRPLYFLYYLVRPIRLFVKRIGKTRVHFR